MNHGEPGGTQSEAGDKHSNTSKWTTRSVSGPSTNEFCQVLYKAGPNPNEIQRSGITIQYLIKYGWLENEPFIQFMGHFPNENLHSARGCFIAMFDYKKVPNPIWSVQEPPSMRSHFLFVFGRSCRFHASKLHWQYRTSRNHEIHVAMDWKLGTHEWSVLPIATWIGEAWKNMDHNRVDTIVLVLSRAMRRYTHTLAHAHILISIWLHKVFLRRNCMHACPSLLTSKQVGNTWTGAPIVVCWAQHSCS